MLKLAIANFTIKIYKNNVIANMINKFISKIISKAKKKFN